MAQTPPVKEGFRAGGNKYNPQGRLPFYTPNWLKPLKSQSGKDRGVEGFNLCASLKTSATKTSASGRSKQVEYEARGLVLEPNR